MSHGDLYVVAHVKLWLAKPASISGARKVPAARALATTGMKKS
jgi:hypothetical protein